MFVALFKKTHTHTHTHNSSKVVAGFFKELIINYIFSCGIVLVKLHGELSVLLNGSLANVGHGNLEHLLLAQVVEDQHVSDNIKVSPVYSRSRNIALGDLDSKMLRNIAVDRIEILFD